MRLRQVTSFGLQPLSICRLISTGKSRNDFVILRNVAVSIGTCVCLTKRQSSKHDMKSPRVYETQSIYEPDVCLLSWITTNRFIEHIGTQRITNIEM